MIECRHALVSMYKAYVFGHVREAYYHDLLKYIFPIPTGHARGGKVGF